MFEDCQTWPWQLMGVVGKLLAKKTVGQFRGVESGTRTSSTEVGYLLSARLGCRGEGQQRPSRGAHEGVERRAAH
eukprot:2064277-Pyramimonas_sp.AAC.1